MGIQRSPFHVYYLWASRGLGGFCGVGGCWVVGTVQDTGDQNTPSLTPLPHGSRPLEGPTLLFCHFSCYCSHCSYATSWSNYMQIKNIFFFKTMLKVKIILRVSYRHMFFSRPNQIQLDLNSPNFELLRRYSLL